MDKEWRGNMGRRRKKTGGKVIGVSRKKSETPTIRRTAPVHSDRPAQARVDAVLAVANAGTARPAQRRRAGGWGRGEPKS
jgi:hypothetical protein